MLVNTIVAYFGEKLTKICNSVRYVIRVDGKTVTHRGRKFLDPEVSTTSELFALANGPSWTPVSVNFCLIDGVSLNDLDNATLHIDGQSTVVDAPPDIIDVPDEDDDFIGDEDAIPYDLVDSDVEDLINVDDGVEKMSSADVARSHGGDDGGDDRPPSHIVPTGCEGCFANKGK
ncbi:hypothetical protein Tco_0029779, partial [Tanacetum coccineum]